MTARSIHSSLSAETGRGTAGVEHPRPLSPHEHRDISSPQPPSKPMRRPTLQKLPSLYLDDADDDDNDSEILSDCKSVFQQNDSVPRDVPVGMPERRASGAAPATGSKKRNSDGTIRPRPSLLNLDSTLSLNLYDVREHHDETDDDEPGSHVDDFELSHGQIRCHEMTSFCNACKPERLASLRFQLTKDFSSASVVGDGSENDDDGSCAEEEIKLARTGAHREFPARRRMQEEGLD